MEISDLTSEQLAGWAGVIGATGAAAVRLVQVLRRRRRARARARAHAAECARQHVDSLPIPPDVESTRRTKRPRGL